MKYSNPYDKYIIELQSLLAQIPHFDSIGSSPFTQQLFDELYNKTIEINSLKLLYKDYYCPAALRCISDQKKLLKKSKFIKYSQEIDDELNDVLYSTVRIGYVQLFHHIESYAGKLFSLLNKMCADDNLLNPEEYYDKFYNFKIRKHWRRIDEITEKINWICNRVKHDDGFPNNDISKWPLFYLMKSEFQFNVDIRLQINVIELESDINETLAFLSRLTNIVMKTYIVQLVRKYIVEAEKVYAVNEELVRGLDMLRVSESELKQNIDSIIQNLRKIGIEDS